TPGLHARRLQRRGHLLPLREAHAAARAPRAAAVSTALASGGRIAVVVTTYNQPAMLAAVLEALLAQTDPDFEVIVADDGSTADTAAVVEDVARRAPFPVRHVW